MSLVPLDVASDIYTIVVYFLDGQTFNGIILLIILALSERFAFSVQCNMTFSSLEPEDRAWWFYVASYIPLGWTFLDPDVPALCPCEEFDDPDDLVRWFCMRCFLSCGTFPCVYAVLVESVMFIGGACYMAGVCLLFTCQVVLDLADLVVLCYASLTDGDYYRTVPTDESKNRLVVSNFLEAVAESLPQLICQIVFFAQQSVEERSLPVWAFLLSVVVSVAAIANSIYNLCIMKENIAVMLSHEASTKNKELMASSFLTIHS